MGIWTRDELSKIGSAEELRIVTIRRDGTLRKPVIIMQALKSLAGNIREVGMLISR